MAEIRLVRGEIALVDDEHRERLAQYSWYLSNTGYVVAHIPGELLSMHKLE